MDISSEASLYNENLFKPENNKYLEYLKITRGLTEETINMHNLGVDEKGNITIPIPDPVTPVGIKKRTNPFSPGPNKYLNPGGVPSQIFNEITLTLGDIQEVVLCEGELDALTLEQYDIPAITKTTGGGSSFKKEEIEMLLSRTPKVTIYFGLDTDEPGKKWMLSYANTFIKNERVRFLEVPECKDWNELVVKYQKGNQSPSQIKESLKAILIKAASATDYCTKYGLLTPILPIDFINLSETEDKALEFIADPIIIKNAVNLIAARAGHFKSFLSLAVAISCLKGQDFLGIFKTSPIDTVFLFDLENIPSRVKDRIRLLGGDINKFNILEHEVYFDVEENITDKLIETVKEFPNSLLIIDTLRRANLKLDENSSEEVSNFYSKIKPLTKYTTVLVLHHTLKNKAQYRGSGDIEAGIDSGITISKLDGSNRNFVKLEIEHTKARYTGNCDTVIAEFTFDELGVAVKAYYKEAKQLPKVSYLQKLEVFILGKAQNGSTSEELYDFGSDTLDIGEHQIDELRNKLIESKKIFKVKNYKGKKTYYFHSNFSSQQLNTLGAEKLS